MTERMHPDDLAVILEALAQRAPSPVSSAPALLDAKGAGELLGVPASWVLTEARADRIPHVRLGKYVRFEAAAVEAWWRSRAHGPNGSGGVR